MAFHVGQLCMMRHTKWPWCPTSVTQAISFNLPVCGVVYTVRSTEIRTADGDEYIRLAEIVNSPIEGHEPRFHAVEFRPITKQRLAIFRNLLAPVPVKKRERA